MQAVGNQKTRASQQPAGSQPASHPASQPTAHGTHGPSARSLWPTAHDPLPTAYRPQAHSSQTTAHDPPMVSQHMYSYMSCILLCHVFRAVQELPQLRRCLPAKDCYACVMQRGNTPGNIAPPRSGCDAAGARYREYRPPPPTPCVKSCTRIPPRHSLLNPAPL